MTYTEIIINISLAVVLSALIGAERQWLQKMAGLRTNTLVCVGSALFVSIAGMTFDESSPTRIASQIVSGIGFLGAGVIFKEGLSIRGLNTAATLWCSAAIGALCGSGFLAVAAIGTGAVLTSNIILRPVVRLIDRFSSIDPEQETGYRLCITCREKDENNVRQLLMDGLTRHRPALLCGLFSEDITEHQQARVWADLTTTGRQDDRMEHFVKHIGLQSGVTAVSWKIIDIDSILMPYAEG